MVGVGFILTVRGAAGAVDVDVVAAADDDVDAPVDVDASPDS